jgi:hypothetical protein
MTEEEIAFFHKEGYVVVDGVTPKEELQPVIDEKKLPEGFCSPVSMTMAPPSEVENVVKKTIDAAAPGGGFILSTCNALIEAVPPANALAMYETAHRHGVYGSRAIRR